jgi:S-disulfanyl-L-cysteine oxidoreductase SoxD
MTRAAAIVVVLAVSLTGCATRDGGSAGDDEAAVARGEAIYESSCMGCHGGAEGGAISDIPPRHNAQGHTWHHADCELLDIIADGLPDRPGLPEDAPTMPAFGDDLDADDRRAVLAYIKTWWTPDQLASQRRTTEQVCDDAG